MKYKGIMMDLDGTMYDYERAHVVAERETLVYISRTLDINKDKIANAYREAKITVKNKLLGTASSHSRTFYFQRLLEDLQIYSATQNYKFTEVYWRIFFENMFLYPDCKEFLERVKVPICVVTDMTIDIQIKKIIYLGISDNVQCIVTSDEATHEKPNPYIFLLAAYKLKQEIVDILFIGDDFEKDIVGANLLGIHSVYFRGNKQKLLDNPYIRADNVLIYQSYNEIIGGLGL